MSKGGFEAPSRVNPSALGMQQYLANIATAQKQSELNNVNTTSPFGTSFFNQDANGRWNLNQSLSPELQGLFGSQTGLARILAQKGGDLANIAAGPAQAGAGLVDKAAINLGKDYGAQVNQAQDAAYHTQERYLDPQFQQQQHDLEDKLVSQGIAPGTEAYSRATGDLARQKNFAYSGARDAATTAGNEEQARLFGENTALANTGEGILSGATGQFSGLMPLSEFGWATGVPTYGSQNTTVQGVNVPGIQSAANQANMNNYLAGDRINQMLFKGLGLLGSLPFGGGGG